MTKGLVRYQQTGQLHFVTFSCYDRRPYLDNATSRDLFKQSLEVMRRRYGFFVTAYVVMPEHVHLLISEPKDGTLSRALQALKLSVAMQRKERPFWQKRYYDFNVYGERKLIEKRRYIHRNPVTRGLVKEPDGWKWSSFHHWWTGKPDTVEIESHWTARRRGGVISAPQSAAEP
jgi:putative transposase